MTEPRRAAPAVTLHALLGVAEDISPTQLRLAYDRAIATAVRMTDTRHALALSQAFDALPGNVRDRVYPAVRHRRALPFEPEPGSGRRLRPGRSGTGRIRAGRAVRRRGVPRRRRVSRRIVVLLIVLAVAVPAGLLVTLHWHDWLKRPDHGSNGGLRQPRTAVVLQLPHRTQRWELPQTM